MPRQRARGSRCCCGPRRTGANAADVILNLKPDSIDRATEDNQPFTSQSLTYHVEGSRRPRGRSPAYILFQCLASPEPDRGGQTILRSIDGALAALTRSAHQILSETILYPDATDAPVIYTGVGRTTLNFRDPAPLPFVWCCLG